MTITSIRYQPVEGGALGGHFALHVSIGDGSVPGALFDPTSLATKIHDCFEALGIKHTIKGVLLDCRTAVGSNEEMSSLLATLRDWGLTIVLWVSQDTRHPWFEYATSLVVFVRTKNWPNFRVSEIRYIPTGEMIEPEVFEVNTNAPGYVMPSNGFKTGDLLRFVTEAKRPWGVVFTPRFSPSIEFKLSGD